jgi:hypothetical protein
MGSQTTRPARTERRGRRAGAAEQDHRADLADASRLGAEAGLGTEAVVTRVRVAQAPPVLRRAMIALLSLVVIAFAVAIALAAAGLAWYSVIPGALAVAGVVGLRGLGRRARAHTAIGRLFRYPGGVIQVRTGEPAPKVLPWPEVDAVTLVFNDAEDFSGLTCCTLEGGGGPGAKVTITVAVTAAASGAHPQAVVRDLALEAERQLAPRLVPPLASSCLSGQLVTFGRWQAGPGGITAADHRGLNAALTPWASIEEITVASEVYRGYADPASLVTLMVAGAGRRSRRPSLSLSGVANGMFLPAVLEQVAGGYGVPVRRAEVPPGHGGTPGG